MKARTILTLTAAMVLIVAAGVIAEKQVLILKDGRRFTGDVTKTKDGYQVKTPAGTVVFGADQVERVEEVSTAADEYKRRLAKVEPTDAKGLYQLAAWARANGLLTEAQDLLKKVLAARPTDENARLLLKLVEADLSAGTAAPPPGAGGETVTPPPPTGPADLISKEDVYRIRLLELQKDDKVRVTFRNKLLDRFIDRNRGVLDLFKEPNGERQFRGADPVAQVRYILDNTDRASPLRDDILIETDPTVMAVFRTKVWPIISKGCAGSHCHGGVKIEGKLKLFTQSTSDDQVMYTNFYILHQWTQGGRKLINRDNHEMSLLLQYGLPKDLASLPHPGRITSLYRSRDDRSYRLVEEWIKQLRYPFLPPGYGVKYTLPGMEQEPPPASAPATEPAKRP